jgi:hypothetical protein
MKTLLKSLSFAVAAVAATTAHAGEERFTHEGRTYVYTSEAVNGSTVITGRSYPGGEPFRYLVRGNRVRGETNGRPVAFRLSEAAGAARTATTVAAAD